MEWRGGIDQKATAFLSGCKRYRDIEQRRVMLVVVAESISFCLLSESSPSVRIVTSITSWKVFLATKLEQAPPATITICLFSISVILDEWCARRWIVRWA